MQTQDGSVDQQKHWDLTYKQMIDFFGLEPSELGHSALRVFKANDIKRVLELGSGQGRDTWLFLKNHLNVIAMDYSETAILQMEERAKKIGVDRQLELKVHDARWGIPLPDNSVDAIYSHMFFTMEIKEKELEHIFKECLRVLRPGGLNIYSVRNDRDPHFKQGVHRGEDMWQNPMGFVVHFFSEEKVHRFAMGYDLLWIREFDDTSPPFTKKLYEVVMRKPDGTERA
jgi:ubiquinone/menaquinone biosynthesis C-methylase UbiE